MATHFSILVWEILWTEQPGGLQPMGSQRMGHDLVTKQQYVPDVRNALNVLTYLISDNPCSYYYQTFTSKESRAEPGCQPGHLALES